MSEGQGWWVAADPALAAGAASWPGVMTWPCLALAHPTLSPGPRWRDAGWLGRGAGQQDAGAVLPRAALLLLDQGRRVGPAAGPQQRLLPSAGAGHQVGLLLVSLRRWLARLFVLCTLGVSGSAEIWRPCSSKKGSLCNIIAKSRNPKMHRLCSEHS